MKRSLIVFLLVLGSLAGFTAYAQDMDKEGMKKKIEMAIRRIEFRIDKVDHDLKKMTDDKAKEQSGAYKTKLEAAKAELGEDLKALQTVTKEGWKEFKEHADIHMEEAKTDAKPVML